MLLTGYTKRISRPECIPGSESLDCHSMFNVAKSAAGLPVWSLPHMLLKAGEGPSIVLR